METEYNFKDNYNALFRVFRLKNFFLNCIKMDEIQTNIVDRHVETEDYLKNHKINELFINITSHLVFNKPGKNIFSFVDLIL